LIDYLHESKNSLLVYDGESPLFIYIGNEAGDLDSFVSSIVCAYFRRKIDPEKNLHIPVMPILMENFSLKTEINYLFKKMHIPPRTLTFFDEAKEFIQLAHANNKLKLILLDHNVPRGFIKEFGENVVGVVDHHQDEELYNHLDENKTIEMVGSCCTLVAEHILRTGKDIINKDIATLLLGTILLDTINLDFSKGRGTQKDVDVVQQLCWEFRFDTEENNDLFNAILKAKYDISSLTTTDLLRNDYKEFPTPSSEQYGISTILLPLEQLISRPDFMESVMTFYQSKNLVLHLSMLAYNQGDDFKRELIIFSQNQSIFSMIKDKFLSNEELLLSNYEGDTSSFPTDLFHFCTQKNVKASRKVVQPLVDTFFN